MDFNLTSSFKPTGDQPQAIKKLSQGIHSGEKEMILLGVTGSGKTFTIANVIEKLRIPTLVLSHNKTLAAQLYTEFKAFFPENAVEYFVSYYDYYQPEAYLPTTNTYIEKDLSINQEIEKLRLSTTSSLLSGRKDIIVVSSVSCLYGIGNPENFNENVINIKKGQKISRNKLLHQFVTSLYSRNENEFSRGNFRVKGDTIDIFPAYSDTAYRILFWDEEIESIETFEPLSGKFIEIMEEINIYPANIFITSKKTIHNAIKEIQIDLKKQIDFFIKIKKDEEAKRLEERVNFDLEMIKELGYCSGIENYSRYFDGRVPGSRPFCLLDYFPSKFLAVVDESHVTLPQIRAMYGGDHSRKTTLVEYGFRLPAAMDNRPLKFEEFEQLSPQLVYVSATPAEYELTKTGGEIVEQVIRPTGLLDPVISVRPSLNQIDDLLYEINNRSEKDERILVTTLTKRMAEELYKYLSQLNIRCQYIHSDVDTLKRVEIMEGLRSGLFDVLIGINLLREGLDLPEVSLVAILDADKEGFLRSSRSLIQTAGRAARNLNGTVIMYADKITKAMQDTIDATNYRREKQLAYNAENNITPTSIRKEKRKMMADKTKDINYEIDETITLAADPVISYMSRSQLEKAIKNTRNAMLKASKDLDFLQAAQYRDEMYKLKSIFKEKFE